MDCIVQDKSIQYLINKKAMDESREIQSKEALEKFNFLNEQITQRASSLYGVNEGPLFSISTTKKERSEKWGRRTPTKIVTKVTANTKAFEALQVAMDKLNKNGDISKLTRVEDQPEEIRKKFEIAREKWLFTPEFDEQAQENILSTIYGITAGSLIDNVLQGKSVRILYEDRDGIPLQLHVKRAYQDVLADLYERKDLSTEEENLKGDLSILLRENVWAKFQEAILDKLKAFGYKQTNEQGEFISTEQELRLSDYEIGEEGLPAIGNSDNSIVEEDFERGTGYAGKGSSFKDMASAMLRNKSTMSNDIKVWLSAIPSTEASRIAIRTYKGKKSQMDTTFKSLNEVIDDVNSATIGNGESAETMIAALRTASTQLPDKEHLGIIANMLQAAFEKGEKIGNEFYTKFYQTINELLLVKVERIPRKMTFEGSQIDERDTDGKVKTDLKNSVINLNRNEVAPNLRESWLNSLRHSLYISEDGVETLDTEFIKDVNDKWSELQKELPTYFDADGALKFTGEENIEEVRTMIRGLLNYVGIDVNNRVMDELILYPSYDQKFLPSRSKKNRTAFSNKTGILSTIFKHFNAESPNPEAAFRDFGTRYLSEKMAKYVTMSVTSSTRNTKGNLVSNYGMHDHFSQTFWKLKAWAKDLDALQTRAEAGEEIQVTSPILDKLRLDFKGKSKILQDLSMLRGDALSIYLNRLEYAIFDVTKGNNQGSRAKELSEQNEREFTATEIALFTNHLIKEDGNTWSYKYLTTPSDKSKMIAFRTKDHESEIDISTPQTKVMAYTTEAFYHYFLGEYDSIKSYLNGDAEFRAAIDANTTREPKIFYGFGQFNIKNPILWVKEEDGNFKLRDITPEVELYIKEKITEQVQQDIDAYTSLWEKSGLIRNGKLITGINPAYVNSMPVDASHRLQLKGLRDNIDLLKSSTKIPDLERATGAAAMEVEFKALSEQADKDRTRYLTADFVINKHLHNMEMHMLVLGDPRDMLKSAKEKLTWEQFNTWNDLAQYTKYLNKIRDNKSKRMALAPASGTIGLYPKDKQTKNALYFIDTPAPSKILSEIEKANKEAALGFGSIEVQDGQMNHTAEADLDDKLALGKISKAQYDTMLAKTIRQAEDIEKTGEVQEANLFSLEEKNIAQAQKPVITGDVDDAATRSSRIVYIKPSSVALYPEFTQGFETDKLRRFIYNRNKKVQKSGGKRIDILPRISAAKLGAISPISGVFNPDGTINAEALDVVTDANIDEIPVNSFKIQQEVPFDPAHTTIGFSSQEVKMLFGEVLDEVFETSGILDLGKDTMTGQELKDLHNEIYSTTFDLHYTHLMRQTGASYNSEAGRYEWSNLSKLQAILKEHADQTQEDGLSLTDLDGLRLTDEGDEFVIPLGFLGDPTAYERLLWSLFKGVIKQRVSGRSFIMATETGFRPSKKEKIKGLSGDEAKNWINYNVTNVVWVSDQDGLPGYDPSVGLLPQRPDPKNPKRTLPGQMAITWNFQNEDGEVLDINDFITVKDGHKFLDVAKMDADLLRSIGIRIPVGGFPSMSDMAVVCFIPPMMGDLIISSQDLVRQMGADFDIDKLYSYLYNYFYGHEGDTADDVRELEYNFKGIISQLKLMPKNSEQKRRIEFMEDVQKKTDTRFDLEKNKTFAEFMAYSIDTRTADFNKKYGREAVPDELHEFLTTLTPQELEAINKATFSEKRKLDKTESGYVMRDKVTLEDLYSGYELELAKSLKNHITTYNAAWKMEMEEALKVANTYKKQLANREAVSQQRDEVLAKKKELDKEKKLLKIHPNWNSIKSNSIKQLHNALQDIHHAILSHTVIWNKMLEGINEGNLPELAAEMRLIKPTTDTELPSMYSGRYTTEEYFSNRGAVLGKGVFSAANAFMTLAEGKGIIMRRPNPDAKVYGKGKYIPDPLVIIDSDNQPHDFAIFANGKGFTKIESIFQSASMDDAKLKVLALVNQNKHTMGITGMIGGLADDNIVDTITDKPLLTIDFITYFLNQPSILEYISAISTGNDSLEQFSSSTFKADAYDNILHKYSEELHGLISSEEFISTEGFKQEDLVMAVEKYSEYKETGDIEDDGDFNLVKFLDLQVKAITKFRSMEDRSSIIRQAQYATNTDSKGTPESSQEAQFKEALIVKLMEDDDPYVGGLHKLFVENGESTLTSTFADIGIRQPLILLQGTEFTGPIVPTASVKYRSFIEEFKNLRGVMEDNIYNSKFANTAWSAFLSFMFSDPRLELSEMKTRTKRFVLLYDTAVNKSLGTRIEEFMQSPIFINSPILKPLFNSLRIKEDKKNPGMKFIDFIGSTGIAVTKKDIGLALFFLKDVNYDLFEKMLQFAMLVSPANSPTSLRKFVPNIYLDAIGLAEKMRALNRGLNLDLPDASISIHPYLPPVRPAHQMLLQHEPSEAPRFDPETVAWIQGEDMFETSRMDNPDLYRFYKGTEDAGMYPMQFLSTFDAAVAKGFALYKLVEFGKRTLYARIDTLGAYNVSEFDASYFGEEPITSILPGNRVGVKFINPDAFEAVDRNIATSIDQIMGNSGAAFGADTMWHVEGKQFGIPFTHHIGPNGTTSSLNKVLTEEEVSKSVNKLSKEELAEGYKAIQELSGDKKLEVNDIHDLWARDYFQVKYASAVYAIAELASPSTVAGGTNWAVRFAKQAGKPIFVWDIKTQKWYKWNGTRFVPSVTPYLTKDFAAVGTRRIQKYKVPVFKEDTGELSHFEDSKHVSQEIIDAARQAIRDVYEKTLQVIGGSEKTETAKKTSTQQKPTSVVTYNSIKDVNVGHLQNKYGYDANKSGKENIVTILSKISKSSNKDSYRILADILLRVAKLQGTLDGIKFVLGDKDEYGDNTLTLNVDKSIAKLSDEANIARFESTIQYNLLHELGHRFLDAKMTDGSEVSRILERNVKEMIATLETPENLAKAISLLQLKNTTPEQLIAKLALLRAEANTRAAPGVVLTQFANDTEKSILNPLINPREFVTSLLNDEGTQKWANHVQRTGSKQNIFSKFFDILKGMFNNFLRSLGLKLSKNVDTVLTNGIKVITDLLAKDPIGIQRSALEELQPDHTVSMEMNGFDPGKLGKKPLMWMPKDAKFRPDVKANTLIGATIEGTRIQTSRTKTQRKIIEAHVGGVTPDGIPKGNPYIWVRDDNNNDEREILVKIQKIHQKSNAERGITPEIWSAREGWDESHVVAKPDLLGSNYYAVDFEYIDPAPLTKTVVPPAPINDLKPGIDDSGQFSLFSKLTGVDDIDNTVYDEDGREYFSEVPEDTPAKAAEDELQRRHVIYLGDRLNSLYDTKSTLIKSQPTDVASIAAKEKELGEIQRRIDSINIDRDKMIKNYDLETFLRIADKDLTYLERLVMTPNISSTKLLEAIQILNTYSGNSGLYDRIAEDAAYRDILELPTKQAMANAKERATAVLDHLNDRRWEVIQPIIQDALGRYVSREEFFKMSKESGYTRGTFFPAVESVNSQTQVAGKLLGDMGIKVDMAKQHLTTTKIDPTYDKFVTKGGFDPKNLYVTYDVKHPITGIDHTKKSFLARYDHKAYAEAFGALYAPSPLSKKYLVRWRNRQLRLMQVIIDPRALDPEDYNNELDIAPQKRLTLQYQDDYVRALYNYFTKIEYSDKPEKYGSTRAFDLYTQAVQRLRDYQEERDSRKVTIEAMHPNDIELQKRLLWEYVSANSPYLYMDGKYAQDPDATFTKIDLKPHRSNAPVLSTDPLTGKPEFQQYSVHDPETGKTKKLYFAASNVKTAARRINLETGNKTGYINEKYIDAELEDFEKNEEIRNRNLDRVATDSAEPLEEEVPTLMGFLNASINLQKDIIRMFPYEHTRELRYYDMLDVSKTMDELRDVSLWYKYSLIPQMAWDGIVNMASTKYVPQERAKTIDLITNEAKQRISAATLSGSMDNLGLGDRKTDDWLHYFDTISSAGVEYAGKAAIEKLIKIFQDAYNNETYLKPSVSVGADKTPFHPGIDKKTAEWTINSILYNQAPDVFGVISSNAETEARSVAFRQGLIPLEDLHSSNTKLFGVFNPKYKLTYEERLRKGRLEEQQKKIQEKIDALPASATDDEREKLGEELAKITKAVNRIVRVSAPVNKARSFETWVRLKYLGYNATGRLVHTLSSCGMNELEDMFDPRISSPQALTRAYMRALPLYGFDYAAWGAGLYTATSLVPVIGFAGGYTTGVFEHGLMHPDFGLAHMFGSFNNLLDTITPFSSSAGAVGTVVFATANKLVNNPWSHWKHETDLILQEIGLDTYLKTTAESQIRRDKEDSPLTPMGFVGKGDTFNKKVTGLRVAEHFKLMCPDGKERSIIEAFKLVKGKLVWNTEVFGSRDSQEMQLTGPHTKNMVKLRSMLATAIKRIQSDSPYGPKLYQKSRGIGSFVLFLQSYRAQQFNRVFGDDQLDAQSGIAFVGQTTAAAEAVSRLFRKSNMSGPGFAGTSLTGYTVGFDEPVFDTQHDLQYIPGDKVHVSSGANYIEGVVTEYKDGKLKVKVTKASGRGNRSSTWTIKPKKGYKRPLPPQYIAALKGMAFGLTVVASFALSAYYYHKYTEEHPRKKMFLTDGQANQIISVMTRIEMSTLEDPTELLNKSIARQNALLGYILKIGQVFSDVKRAATSPEHPELSFWKADKMTSNELAANGLAVDNKVDFKGKVPIWNQHYGQILHEDMTIYRPTIGGQFEIPANVGKYTYPKLKYTPSRIMFHAEQLLPIISISHNQSMMQRAGNLSRK